MSRDGLHERRSQLEKARRLVTAGKGRVRLIQANAEHVPLREPPNDLHVAADSRPPLVIGKPSPGRHLGSGIDA